MSPLVALIWEDSVPHKAVSESSGGHGGVGNMNFWCALGIDFMDAFLKHATESQVEVQTKFLIQILKYQSGQQRNEKPTYSNIFLYNQDIFNTQIKQMKS